MGNMLESESSASDAENEIADPVLPVSHSQRRTAGDGMEKPPTTSFTHGVRVNDNNLCPPSTPNLEQSAVIDFKSLSEGPETVSSYLPSDQIDIEKSIIAAKRPISSPRQLPSKELLIPIKPPRLEKSNSGATQKSLLNATNTSDMNNDSKQRNPKFVPYEPYSCATRPIEVVEKKAHSRKPSDSSSVISQCSTISYNDVGSARQQDLMLSPTQIQPGPDRSPGQRGSTDISGSQSSRHHHHHPSTTLLKERLKMTEKDMGELQVENTRLKKLLLDSITGVWVPTDNNNLGKDVTTHEHHESMDNLNDELEVWRSKFLSSCVLVEQLTKDNHELNSNIVEASEIIKDLKNSVSLTQRQYENINSWLRKTNCTTSYPLRQTLPDSNFETGQRL